MRMPQIEWPVEVFEEPVPNKDFMNTKVRQTEDMLYRLQPYVDTLFTLTGLQGRKDIKEVVWFVLREFAAFFGTCRHLRTTITAKDGGFFPTVLKLR